MVKGNSIAQGSYAKWLREREIEKSGGGSTNDKIQQIKQNATDSTWRGIVNTVRRGQGISWRTWARVLADNLSTNARIMMIAKASKGSIYNEVYGDTLGAQGRCTRDGCGCGKETVSHAILTCEH